MRDRDHSSPRFFPSYAIILRYFFNFPKCTLNYPHSPFFCAPLLSSRDTRLDADEHAVSSLSLLLSCRLLIAACLLYLLKRPPLIILNGNSIDLHTHRSRMLRSNSRQILLSCGLAVLFGQLHCLRMVIIAGRSVLIEITMGQHVVVVIDWRLGFLCGNQRRRVIISTHLVLFWHIARKFRPTSNHIAG